MDPNSAIWGFLEQFGTFCSKVDVKNACCPPPKLTPLTRGLTFWWYALAPGKIVENYIKGIDNRDVLRWFLPAITPMNIANFSFFVFYWVGDRVQQWKIQGAGSPMLLPSQWRCDPVKKLSSQLTHLELTLKLMVGSFWGYSVSSKWTHIVSLLWALCEFATHTMS